MSTNTFAHNRASGGAGGAVYSHTAFATRVDCADGKILAHDRDNVYAYALPSPDFASQGCSTQWVNNTMSAGGYGPAIATGVHKLAAVNGSRLSWPSFNSNEGFPLVFGMVDGLGSQMRRGSADSNLTMVVVSGNCKQGLPAV